MKELPIGIETFKKIITGNHVYADKTKLIYNLVKTERPFFLSRPRRFGKSLLLSTFQALFQGPQEPDGPPQGLFKDLWIGQSDYDFSQTYPVITLSMAGDYNSSEDLRDSILDDLRDINDFYGLGLKISLPGKGVTRLIEKLSRTLKKKVVVLIDEYDAPVSDKIGNITLARKNRDVLKSFYSGFKKTDQYLRFVFVTGVTRYAFMGLSAGFNQLDDLTINDEYADICGFTHDDLDNCFGEYLPIVLEKMKENGNMPKKASEIDLKNKILNWYDGYNWGGKTNVLNPWSIMKFFQQGFFSDFWLGTAPSASFLTDLHKGDPFALLENNFEDYSLNDLGLAEVGSLKTIPALFQTGFLTIDKTKDIEDVGRFYSLKVPNLEIKNINSKVFSGFLTLVLGRDPKIEIDSFHNALIARNGKKLTEILNSLFSGLDAIHHEENESCYHKILYGFCSHMTPLTIAEYHGAVGNPDLVTIFPVDNLYVLIELKFSSTKSIKNPVKSLTTAAKNALKAIDGKDYAVPWKAKAQELIKIGIGVTHKGKCVALIGD